MQEMSEKIFLRIKYIKCTHSSRRAASVDNARVVPSARKISEGENCSFCSARFVLCICEFEAAMVLSIVRFPLLHSSKGDNKPVM